MSQQISNWIGSKGSCKLDPKAMPCVITNLDVANLGLLTDSYWKHKFKLEENYASPHDKLSDGSAIVI